MALKLREMNKNWRVKMMLEKTMENFEGKFWTRRHEMEEEIESLNYEIIENNGYDHIVVVDLMDDDEPEITLRIGHANGTMWVKEVL